MLNSGCNIVALDNSDYATFSNITKHTIVEFIKDASDIVVEQRTHDIESADDSQIKTSLPIVLASDGTYTYYRMLMPSLEHLYVSGVYLTANKYFTYKGEVYYTTKNLYSLDVSSCTLITDYTKVWETREQQGQIYWYNQKFFSYCSLNKCLLNLLKKSINEAVKNGCDFGCDNTSSNQTQIDFLLVSMYAIRLFVEQGKFEDAQRVVNALTKCGSLCAEDTTDLNGCGCGSNS